MGAEKNLAALKSGGFMQQKQDGYFSMRLKVVGGPLTTFQLMTIQRAADRFGKGYVHLTSRQGVEIPFIHIDDIDAVKQFFDESGCVEIGVCGPRVRTITACQGNAICSSGNIDTTALANKLDARYGGRTLPHKFKIGVTGCANNCLKAEENDIGIKGGVRPECALERCIFCGGCAKVCPVDAITVDRSARSWTIDRDKCINCGRCVKRCKTALSGEHGYLVYFGGRFGREIAIGQRTAPLITNDDELFNVIDQALEYFNANAKRGERFSSMLARVPLAPSTEQSDPTSTGASRINF